MRLQLKPHPLARPNSEASRRFDLEEERIAIADLADELQVRMQRIFKILKRLGITPTQRREPTRGNQMIATVTIGEAHGIRTEVELG
jgi:hypothetical protein